MILATRNVVREVGGSPPRGASSTIDEPVRVAESGPADPPQRKWRWKGVKANGRKARRDAAGRYGERRNAVREIAASTPDSASPNAWRAERTAALTPS
jgi:hypothetical protein